MYANKNILITGHTGFKGSWLSAWLSLLGGNVVGFSKDVPTTPSNFEISEIGKFSEDYRGDIRDPESVKKIVQKCRPDFIFHLAAQALVRPSYESPLETMRTNALGSASVLDAVKDLDKPTVVIMVTSDKVYKNKEWPWGYRETDRLGDRDPYSASKAMAETAIQAYVGSYFVEKNSGVRVGIARAGNVIGGGDWSQDRIVPDCIKAWSNGEIAHIRKPGATRPWQHVLEPLSGYLSLGLELAVSSVRHGEAYNFGPSTQEPRTVKDLILEMEKYWGRAKWKDISHAQEHVHEASLLQLNCDKALVELNWKPTLLFEDTVRMTIEWYRTYYEKGREIMKDFTFRQINEYMKLAQQKGNTRIDR